MASTAYAVAKSAGAVDTFVVEDAKALTAVDGSSALNPVSHVAFSDVTFVG